jgi:hypothetical protein
MACYRRSEELRLHLVVLDGGVALDSDGFRLSPRLCDAKNQRIVLRLSIAISYSAGREGNGHKGTFIAPTCHKDFSFMRLLNVA